MEIRYRLQQMEETEFMFKPDFDFKSAELTSVNYQFTHQFKQMPENSELAVSMVVEITPASSNEVIVRQGIYCVFWIDPYDKVVQLKEGNFSTTEPILIDTFINITIGAMRGMLVKNLKGTPMAGCVMPLIPMDYIRQNSIQTTNEQNK